MIQIIYAFSLILLLAPNVMAAEEIDFSFNCKVLDQQLLGITDGKSSRYSGYEGGTKVGDTFKLDFRYVRTGGKYYLQMTSDHKELTTISFTVFDSDFESLSNNGLVLWEDSSGFGQRLSDNVINLDGKGHSQITGRRYYKNDWNLMLRLGNWDEIFIQTANCMNVPSKLGVMLEKIRAFHR
jgi:hypothetical protein